MKTRMPNLKKSPRGLWAGEKTKKGEKMEKVGCIVLVSILVVVVVLAAAVGIDNTSGGGSGEFTFNTPVPTPVSVILDYGDGTVLEVLTDGSGGRICVDCGQ